MVLILLIIYLSHGIKQLLNFWNVLTFYQAFVLINNLAFQFMVNSPGYDGSKIKEKIDNISDEWITLLHVVGFKKYDDKAIWYQLAPYVILFSLSVLLNHEGKLFK